MWVQVPPGSQAQMARTVPTEKPDRLAQPGRTVPWRLHGCCVGSAALVSDCLWLQAPTASPAPMGKSDRPEKTVTLSC
jgi:hypothetical protein